MMHQPVDYEDARFNAEESLLIPISVTQEGEMDRKGMRMRVMGTRALAPCRTPSDQWAQATEGVR
jgi:hypothetical protein